MRIFLIWLMWLLASAAEFLWLVVSLSGDWVQARLGRWSDWAETELLIARAAQKARRGAARNG